MLRIKKGAIFTKRLYLERGGGGVRQKIKNKFLKSGPDTPCTVARRNCGSAVNLYKTIDIYIRH